MNRYPGNHMDSGIVTVPRQLKTRPGAPQTHLAYITGDEAKMIQEHKPGTPHEGAAGIPNYDTWGIDTSGNVTGGSTADGGDSWSGDTGGGSWGGGEDWGPGGGSDEGGSTNNNWNYNNDNDYVEPYTPPNEIYEWLGGGISPENWVNVSQVGGGPNTPGSLLYGVDLESYGYSSNVEFLPQDFLDMLFEGSWTTGNEAVENAALAPDITPDMTPGEVQEANEAAMAAGWEPNIGTWSDVEAGNHPLFPGGLPDYYDPYGNIEGSTIVGGGPGGGPGWGNWGGWGNSNLNYGNSSGYGKYADWGNRPFMTQSFDSPMPQYYASLKNPGQPTNIAKFINKMANMYNSGIRSLG